MQHVRQARHRRDQGGHARKSKGVRLTRNPPANGFREIRKAVDASGGCLSHPELSDLVINRGEQLAERKGFEPSIRVNVYALSRGAPSATRPPLQRRQVPTDQGQKGQVSIPAGPRVLS